VGNHNSYEEVTSMKLYEEVSMYEKKIFKAKEQTSFLKGTLESIDVAIQLRKKKLDEDIATYNSRAKREQEILEMYNKNILEWTKKLDKLFTKSLKSIDKEKVEIIVEKSEKERRKEELQDKKRILGDELKKAKEQLESMKALKPIEPEINEDKIQEAQIEIVREHKENVNGQLQELESGKVQCPECGIFFTKGGAFASHYNAHFNGKE
jgi:hypothetical protein